MAFVIRAVTRGVSTTMGLVGEKYNDHKERKAALKEQGEEDNAASDAGVQEVSPKQAEDEMAADEVIWRLDEAAGDPPGYEESQAMAQFPMADRTISELVHDTKAMMPHENEPQPPLEQAIRLPYPVVIPQRRPGTKGRGFARAYPPALEAFDMDQESFLSFLDNFDKASQADPWLNVLFVSAGVVGLVPSHITMALSISVQIAAGTAIELQSRYRANGFLDQMNKEIFMPKGLYAMILMCKDGPGTAEQPEFGFETVNLDNVKQIAKWGLPKQNEDEEPDVSGSKKTLRNIRLVSGKTKKSDMPLEIAPLIYPGLEDMIERPQIKRDESFKDKLMRNKEFVADYFDRRAKAEYIGNNPDSALTKASSDVPQFSNRFADPNHPANNGHLFSLVSGGKYVAQPRGRRRRNRLREVGEDGKLKPKVYQEHKIRGPISLVTHGVRKVMQKNILYLTIVNLPNEAELAEAKEALNMEGSAFKDFMKRFQQPDKGKTSAQRAEYGEQGM